MWKLWFKNAFIINKFFPYFVRVKKQNVEEKKIRSLATILEIQDPAKKKKLPQGKRAGVRDITCALKKSSL